MHPANTMKANAQKNTQNNKTYYNNEGVTNIEKKYQLNIIFYLWFYL